MSTSPIMATVTEIRDPKLRVVARNVRAMCELAMARVAAHHASPGAITLPTRGLESAFAERFATLPADVRRRAAERATALLASSGDRVGRFGPAGGASLRSPLPIAEQVRTRLVPANLGLTAAYLAELGVADDPPTAAAAGFRPLVTLDKLELRLHRVRCVDETNPETGGDEILLGGTSVSAAGKTTLHKAFTTHDDFDDGEVKNYNPPRSLATYSLVENTPWPKTFFFTMVLAEEDNGGFPKFLEKLWNEVKGEVETAIIAAVGGVVGSIAGPLGTAIGAAVGWAVAEIWRLFKSWWEDDTFEPRTISLRLPAIGTRWANGATDSPEGVLRFQGHGGTYDVTYDWRIFV